MASAAISTLPSDAEKSLGLATTVTRIVKSFVVVKDVLFMTKMMTISERVKKAATDLPVLVQQLLFSYDVEDLLPLGFEAAEAVVD